MRWTRKKIVQEIKRLHDEDAELYYSAAERDHLNLVRAAAWHYGTWRLAVEAAGVDYEKLSRYTRWSRERIIERIRELHKEGADLSWRTISTETDPRLAAAAIRANGFSSWRDAIKAAGLDSNDTSRYKFWDKEVVVKEIKALKRSGAALSSKNMQANNQSLFCAARRRFGSWDAALDAAGFDHSKIRLRRPRGERQKEEAAAEKAASKSKSTASPVKKAATKKKAASRA